MPQTLRYVKARIEVAHGVCRTRPIGVQYTLHDTKESDDRRTENHHRILCRLKLQAARAPCEGPACRTVWRRGRTRLGRHRRLRDCRRWQDPVLQAPDPPLSRRRGG